MIVSLSQDVCQQLQQIERIETIKDNAESIKATLEALTLVKESVAQMVTLIALLRDRLPFSDVQNLMLKLDRLAKEIKASRERFETEPRQTKSLSSIHTSIQNLTKEVKKLWKLYAEECIREPFELLNLVINLPEVAAQKTVYDELKKRLISYVDEPPLTCEQLTDFDQLVHMLTQRLSSIEGLSAEVKIFLQRTLRGEATLIDLTDEVLRWCRQGDHARIFAVRFNR